MIISTLISINTKVLVPFLFCITTNGGNIYLNILINALDLKLNKIL